MKHQVLFSLKNKRINFRMSSNANLALYGLKLVSLVLFYIIYRLNIGTHKIINFFNLKPILLSVDFLNCSMSSKHCRH